MIADHMPTLHQRSLLRREDVETMLISTIGSRSTSARTVDQMESARKYPSENYDLYHAYTSFASTILYLGDDDDGGNINKL